MQAHSYPEISGDPYYLSADERAGRFPAVAAECLRLKADVIATTTTPAALAAKTQLARSRSS